MTESTQFKFKSCPDTHESNGDRADWYGMYSEECEAEVQRLRNELKSVASNVAHDALHDLCQFIQWADPDD